MSTPPAPAPRAVAPLAWLLIAPAAVGLGSAAAPHLIVGDAAASAIAAILPVSAAVASLTLAGRAAPPMPVRLALGIGSALLLGALAVAGVSSAAGVVAATLGLLGLAHALGDGIGRKITDAGHLAPACAVAAGADVASVLSPEGPTNAIAQSDAALSVLAIAGPVPGLSGAFAPTLGLGDLVFLALLLSGAARHGIPRGRVAAAGAVGIAAALLASATLGLAVPALPAIGLAAVIGVPAFRKVRPRDRTAAWFGVVVGAALALGAAARTALAPTPPPPPPTTVE